MRSLSRLYNTARARQKRTTMEERARLRAVEARHAMERTEAAYERAGEEYDKENFLLKIHQTRTRSQRKAQISAQTIALSGLDDLCDALADTKTELENAIVAFTRMPGLTDVESRASSTCKECVFCNYPSDPPERLTTKRLDVDRYQQDCHICETTARPNALRLFVCDECDGPTCSNCLEPMPP